ncbi:hypothetical protein [Streptomyces sp. MBT62]|uniref:hypothetical protein n=1 Tax=Streptomyces sp. MBT62 TaxID=2800410 RepID=UPI00190A527C|nr:hypothetical protein [Streptomyces sp. MBT62]MBK3565699.1 hypothetical protein [Streptomyces sp. MBT62]
MGDLVPEVGCSTAGTAPGLSVVSASTPMFLLCTVEGGLQELLGERSGSPRGVGDPLLGDGDGEPRAPAAVIHFRRRVRSSRPRV